MNENGRFSDFAEVWTSANRMRTLFLTSLLASIIATFAEGWKRLRARAVSVGTRSRPART